MTALVDKSSGPRGLFARDDVSADTSNSCCVASPGSPLALAALVGGAVLIGALIGATAG